MKKMLLMAMAAGVSMAAFANTQEMRQVKIDAVPSQSQSMQLRTADQKAVSSTKIVSQKALGNGYSLNVFSDANGKYRKVLNKNNAPKLQNNNANSVVPKAMGTIAPMAEGDGVALSEGFEGYDGSDNWVPDGWTLEATEALLGSTYTWGGDEPFLYSPYEGDYTMSISAIMSEEYNTAGVDEQNEWLITPSFTVEEYQALNFYASYTPFFMFDIEGMDFVNMTFTEKKCAYTVRVYASVDNGEWVELYDLFSDFENLDFIELLMNYSDLTWYHYKIDLADYVGKNIRIAFQYQGMYGDTFALDAVSVAVPQPQACYQRPGGAYYLGMDEEWYSLNSDYMLAAPYADLTWYNTSNSDSESFLWTYTDPETGEEGVSTDIDLITNYEYVNDAVTVPTLTAYAEGASENTYGWNGDGVLIGGSCMFSFSDGSISRYGVSTADVSNNKYTAIILDDDGTMAFGFNPNSRELWSPVFGLSGDDDNYVEVTEIGNLFPAPEVPYSLERVYMMGEGTVDAGTTVNMTIYAVDEMGYIGDVIATGHITGSDVAYPIAGENVFTMGFDILQQDDFGFEMPAIIAVNSAIYVSVTVENIGNSNFGFYQTAYASANNETNGYFRVVGKQEGEDVNSLQSINGLQTSSGPCYNSFLFYLTASYDVMHCDESTAYLAPDNGGTKTFNVVSNYATAGWSVELSDESADWFTYSVADGDDGINSTITFEVDALPAGVQGRSCNVTVSVSPSASLTFTIGQGEGSGVESTVVASAAKVNVVNGDFVITAPESINAVSVYNIAGQLINTAAVDGTTTVDGASLAQGVYILKFNDGSSVKVVK